MTQSSVPFHITKFTTNVNSTQLQLTGRKIFSSLTKLTVKLGTITEGKITKSKPSASIFASPADFQALSTALVGVPPAELLLMISFDDPGTGTVLVDGLSCGASSAIALIAQGVTSIAVTTEVINQRLARDLSGELVQELRQLNLQVKEGLKLLRQLNGGPEAGGRKRPTAAQGRVVKPAPALKKAPPSRRLSVNNGVRHGSASSA